MAGRSTLVLTALAVEAAPLVRAAGLRRLVPDPRLRGDGGGGRCPGFRRAGIAYAGTSGDERLIVAVTGMGRRRAEEAAQRLIAEHEPGRVLIAGLAAGLRPGCQVGQVIVPAEIIDEPTGERLRPTAVCAVSGRLMTVDRVLRRCSEKAVCFERFGADIADMESAAAARVCVERGVPWLCIRVVSDTAEADLPAGVERLMHPDGRADVWAAVRLAVRHPGRIGRLIRLGRDARAAAGALTERLAELMVRRRRIG